MEEKIAVSVKNIRKSYNDVEVLKGINLNIHQGEFVSLLGPSGCGKTTLLRIIAGFLEQNDGVIEIEGKDVTKLPSYKRKLGMVFQSYALWPHMNVEKHIRFGLKFAKLGKKEIDERVKWALDLVGLTGYEKRMPNELSGGQQQRVAIARALSLHPSILLLDEPLSNLDAKLKDEMRVEIRKLQRQLGITTIYVTHDQKEAITMSDRIIVFHGGRIEQEATPRELFEKPATRFVANFIGIMNFINVRVLNICDGKAELLYGNKLLQDEKKLIVPVNNTEYAREDALLVLRPQNMTFTEFDPEGQDMLKAIVESSVYEGIQIRYEVKLEDGTALVVVTSTQCNWQVGDIVGVRINEASLVPKGEEDYEQ